MNSFIANFLLERFITKLFNRKDKVNIDVIEMKILILRNLLFNVRFEESEIIY